MFTKLVFCTCTEHGTQVYWRKAYVFQLNTELYKILDAILKL
jgi:hypothetical protein